MSDPRIADLPECRAMASEWVIRIHPLVFELDTALVGAEKLLDAFALLLSDLHAHDPVGVAVRTMWADRIGRPDLAAWPANLQAEIIRRYHHAR